MKIGNYAPSFLKTAMAPEGSYDILNYDAAKLKTETTTKEIRELGAVDSSSDSSIPAEVHQYEFIIIPNMGFLCSADPLLKDCQLKLKFDREKPSIALLNVTDTTEDSNLAINITNCRATSEWISSPALRSALSTESKPFIYNFEEISVRTFDIPKQRTNFRLENVFGGNLPTHIFAAIIPSANLEGSLALCPTNFGRHNVTEFNIMVNGSSVNGYPVSLNSTSPIAPFYKFLETTGRLCNTATSGSIKMSEFRYNFLWSHKFEAEGNEGFISISCKLSSAYTTNMTMVVWTALPYAISIDKFNQVEKLIL